MFKKNLDNELSAMIGDNSTKVLGLGVIAFKNAREIYSYFGGRRHINPDKKMTRTTLLRAASVSKMFTVFSIMQLVEQGKINLHDDASKYLGFELRNPNFPAAPITLEMLACHTSSLVDGESYSLPPKNFSATEPGKFFRYCNLNYGILGTIIERVTGERFDIYQQNHILKQLEIGGGYVVNNFDAKTFNRLGTIYRANAAQIDDYKFRPRSNLSRYKIGTNATIFAPQGGLRLSFEDLGKTLQMLMNRGEFNGRRVLSEKSFDAIISPHWIYDGTNGDTYGGVMENYGLGTYKIGGASRARLCKDFEVDLIGHSGEAYGLISGLYFIPNTRDGVIFMINGTAIDVDDERSRGEFSGGYIWEENVMNPVCSFLVDD
ncbi:MAG: serine hydrolase [Selenomonadaceae bacterium]|nr:serine hydrolase [Selenomonadaceae bacterium]